MKEKFWMVNVVWYDGADAYVSKFILKAADEGITKESEDKVKSYLEGNGEVLKFDRLYPMEFDNIIALDNYKNSTSEHEIEEYAAYDRFKTLWF